MPISSDHLTKHVVVPALTDYGLHSTSAVELLLGTAAVESWLGTYLAQVGGPALGIYQMEPTTHDDIWGNFLAYRNGLRLALELEFGKAPTADRLVYDLRYATLMARIHYLRVRMPLPGAGDTDGQAAYWKQHYNTPEGAGSVAKYKAAYRSLVVAG